MSAGARRDRNHAPIVAALRAVPGVSVEPRLADLGRGAPDILVGFRGKTFAFEIKDPDQPPSKQRLTPDEEAWHRAWTGHADVAHTAEQILQRIGAIEYERRRVK